MRYFFLSYLLLIVMVVGIAGFRGSKSSERPWDIFPDMDYQVKGKPQGTNTFFADKSVARKPVPGSVPMGLEHPAAGDKLAADGGYKTSGFTHGSDYYNTGHLGDFYGDGFPEQIVVDEAFLRLGRERYDINCAPCHGTAGNGKGFTSAFGIANIFDFTGPRFNNKADPTYVANGQVFEVITKGKGLMGAYGPNTTVKERWAIIAWVRAIGMTRAAPLSDPAVKKAWDEAPKAKPQS
jgi:mono/diheme cytochrome c family protein